MQENNIKVSDFDSEKNKKRRFLNLMNSVYDLQMKQFAECICSIKLDKKESNYYIQFDPTEKLKPLVLKKDQYQKFISYRDPSNSVCVYDLFQEKVHSYYNSGNTEKKKVFKPKEQIQVAKKVEVTYDYCHHCKQRKPEECMLKCRSTKLSVAKAREQIKIYNMNGTTIVKRKYYNKYNLYIILYIENPDYPGIIIKNFIEDPSEFIDAVNEEIIPEEFKTHQGKKINAANQEIHCHCNRIFCHFCLKGSYDTFYEKGKNFDDWHCPYCTGQCFCSRCTRYESMLKLIGVYISIDGDMNELYEYLITKNRILFELQDSMVLRKILIFVNDPKKKPKEIIQKMLDYKDSKSHEFYLKRIKLLEDYKKKLKEAESLLLAQLHEIKLDQCLVRVKCEKLEKRKKYAEKCADKEFKYLGKKKKRSREYEENNNSDSLKTQDTRQEKKEKRGKKEKKHIKSHKNKPVFIKD